MRALKKLAAVIVMLSVVISMCSCSFLDKVEDFVDGGLDLNQSPLYKEEMVRQIISAVNNPDNIADSFSAIPESQRKDVNYSLYYEYISILRVYLQQGTKRTVTSFMMLNDDQLKEVVDSEVREAYPGLVAAQLSFSIESDIPSYIFLNLDSNGIPHLSYDWIAGTISIYNYADNYFNMLDEGNIEGVNTLISPAYQEAVYTDNVTRSKASALVGFYRDSVRSNKSQYVFESLFPNSISVIVPRVVNEDSELVTHQVGINIDIDGNYIIDDIVLNSPDISAITLYNEDTTLVRCGAFYTKDLLLYGILGEPLYTTSGVEDLDVRVNEDGSVVPKRKVIANYYGVMIVLEAYVTSSGWVDGTIVAIKITGGGDISLGRQLYVGMSKSDILCIYPFVDVEDYSITYSNADIKYVVTFEFDENDEVTNIRVDQVIA